jgi:hypothetical protein
VIDPEYNGKPLTKTSQVRMCGNGVCPPVAAAIIRAQVGARAMEKAASEECEKNKFQPTPALMETPTGAFTAPAASL